MKHGIAFRIFSLLLSLLLLAGSALAFFWAYRSYYRLAYPLEYREDILSRAKENGLDPALVFAVVRTESSFRPEVESSVGARGLMQITKDTMDWAAFRSDEDWEHTYEELYDPQVNLQYGTFILSLLLDEFSTPETALCAYHAGWGNVKKWLSDQNYSSDGVNVDHIPFGDTGKYVEKVMKTAQTYRMLYGFLSE